MRHVGLHVTVEHHALEDAETQTVSTDLRNNALASALAVVTSCCMVLKTLILLLEAIQYTQKSI